MRSVGPSTGAIRDDAGSTVGGQSTRSGSATRPSGTGAVDERRGASARQRWAVAAIAVVPIVMYIWIALRRLRYPFDLEWLEGGAVELVQRVSDGQSLYVAPTFDFTPWPYPPLYFWVSAGVAQVTGDGYVPLRLVSLVSSLAVLVLIAAIVRRVGGTWLGGLAGAGLFAATFQLGGAWADIGRVDSLFLALLLGAVLAGAVARSWPGGVLVGLLIFLAFMTKQNALIAAVPMLVWLVVYRRRVGMTASVVALGASIGSVFVGNAMTDGWYGEYVVAELLGQPVAWRWVFGFWLIDLAVPLALALGVCAWWLRSISRDRGSGRAHPFSAQSYVLAAGVGLVAASWAGRLHSGGFANVVIPAYAAVALGFGLAVSHALGRNHSTTMLRSGWVVALFAVQVAVLMLVPWRGTLPWTLIPTAADEAAGTRLLAVLDRIPGQVVVPVHPHLLAQLERPPHAQSLAVGDVLRGRDGRAKEMLTTDLANALDDVSVVVLDTPGEGAPFEPTLSRDFTALDPGLLDSLAFVDDPDVFRPVTDLAIRPTYVYVRTTELDEVRRVLTP
jgi:Dolichyl-phosphate-mannose-protein mannosyltransferase